MTFARWTFRIAGIYGLVAIVPMYFLETQIGVEQPPPITHAEFFYGFLGCALAWQIAFLIISRDPIRFRPLMLAAMVEKFSFALAAIVLLAQNRIPQPIFVGAMFDLLFGVLFVVAYLKTPGQHESR